MDVLESKLLAYIGLWAYILGPFTTTLELWKTDNSKIITWVMCFYLI